LWKIKETSDCFMSSITIFELLSGAKTDKHFEDIAMVAASMFRKLKRNNQIIDYRDIFIAATAKVHRLTVATLNINHFDRIEGLTLLNFPDK